MGLALLQQLETEPGFQAGRTVPGAVHQARTRRDPVSGGSMVSSSIPREAVTIAFPLFSGLFCSCRNFLFFFLHLETELYIGISPGPAGLWFSGRTQKAILGGNGSWIPGSRVQHKSLLWALDWNEASRLVGRRARHTASEDMRRGCEHSVRAAATREIWKGFRRHISSGLLLEVVTITSLWVHLQQTPSRPAFSRHLH